jgi:hypothetical protein
VFGVVLKGLTFKVYSSGFIVQGLSSGFGFRVWASVRD